MRRPPRRTRRSGFTLVELLVVIVIIGILSALLIPAIQGAVRTARDATVTGEINTLSQALAAFKEKYGDYPPSRIMLNENGFYDTSSATAKTTYVNGTNGADITVAQLAERSLSFLRKFFPRAQFSTSKVLYTDATTGWHDFNGNGGTGPDAGPIILEGHECLVFFLGGIPQPLGDDTWGMSGFSRNPSNPFTNSAVGTSRIPPYYEFKGERLHDTFEGGGPENGFPCYYDTLGNDRPFVYFSAYGAEGYDPNDMAVSELDDIGGTEPFMRLFRVKGAVREYADNGNDAHIAVSASPNPYTTSLANAPTRISAWHKGTSFQIISAGADGLYGAGGQYAPNATPKLPLEETVTIVGTGTLDNLTTTDSNIRSRERDNLTNFASGRLD